MNHGMAENHKVGMNQGLLEHQRSQVTLEDAKKVAQVLTWADGGCDVCVRTCFEIAAEKFPEFPWSEWFNKWREWQGSDDDHVDENWNEIEWEV
jgi:hypothetical protein